MPSESKEISISYLISKLEQNYITLNADFRMSLLESSKRFRLLEKRMASICIWLVGLGFLFGLSISGFATFLFFGKPS